MYATCTSDFAFPRLIVLSAPVANYVPYVITGFLIDPHSARFLDPVSMPRSATFAALTLYLQEISSSYPANFAL